MLGMFGRLLDNVQNVAKLKTLVFEKPSLCIFQVVLPMSMSKYYPVLSSNMGFYT